MNKVILIGNLTKDPELITTANGVNLAKFGIAVSRDFKNANGEKETDFFNCTIWRTLAENLAKYCHKGDKIALTGAVQNREYTDNAGAKKITTEIAVESVEFLNTRNNGGGKQKDNVEPTAPTAPTAQAPKQVGIPLKLDDDTLPF
jgi:single-strand DNA-binding protein